MTVALALFLRAPEPGRTKTRLAAALGDEGAARLYRGFVEDLLARFAPMDELEVRLWCAGDVEHPWIVQQSELYGLARVAQPAGDLGERMGAALQDGIARRGAALVVGSDAPTLPAASVRRATQALGYGDLVVGPAHDGGYYLIGARDRVPAVFEGVPWSTSRVLAETLQRARQANLRVHRLPPWYDVDTPEDLRLLRTHLAADRSAAPRTAEWLLPRE
jgi:rSAM/selenodomain-associated transferase 1